MTKQKERSFFREVGADITNVRKWRKFSQIQAAELIDVDLKTYREIEKGETESLTLKQIHKMVMTYDCWPEEIVPNTFF